MADFSTFFRNATITIAEIGYDDNYKPKAENIKTGHCFWDESIKLNKNTRSITKSGGSSGDHLQEISIEAKVIVKGVSFDNRKEYRIKKDDMYYKVEEIIPFPAIFTGAELLVSRHDKQDITF